MDTKLKNMAKEYKVRLLSNLNLKNEMVVKI